MKENILIEKFAIKIINLCDNTFLLFSLIFLNHLHAFVFLFLILEVLF